MKQIEGIIMKKLLVLLACFVVSGIAFPQIGEAVDDHPIKILCTNCNGERWAKRCMRDHPGDPVTCCRKAQERCKYKRCKRDYATKSDLLEQCERQCENAWTTCLNNVPSKPQVKQPARIPTTTSPAELAPEPSSRPRRSPSKLSPGSAPKQVAPK